MVIKDEIIIYDFLQNFIAKVEKSVKMECTTFKTPKEVYN